MNQITTDIQEYMTGYALRKANQPMRNCTSDSQRTGWRAAQIEINRAQVFADMGILEPTGEGYTDPKTGEESRVPVGGLRINHATYR